MVGEIGFEQSTQFRDISQNRIGEPAAGENPIAVSSAWFLPRHQQGPQMQHFRLQIVIRAEGFCDGLA